MCEDVRQIPDVAWNGVPNGIGSYQGNSSCRVSLYAEAVGLGPEVFKPLHNLCACVVREGKLERHRWCGSSGGRHG
jgi:hypothetical protein